jgi:electron transfer flavoprotein beta subunit
VPAKDAPLRLDEASGWIKEAEIGFETNEPDTFALEEGLRLREKFSGQLTVVSLGPERVKQTIKEALAKGADRGVHVHDDRFHQLDPLGVATELAAAIRREEYNLVLTGLQSDDHGYAQVGVILAELLGLPHATIIKQMEVLESAVGAGPASGGAGRLKVKRELEGGWFQWVELPMPALLTIQSGINKPRYATLKGIMAAKKKEITTLTRSGLSVSVMPTQNVERIYVPTKSKKTEIIPGSAKEASAKLVEKLKHEARVI